MAKRSFRVLPLFLSLVLSLGLLASTASAEPAPRTGRVEVTIVTEDGVPATVTLRVRGVRRYVATKSPAGSRGRTTITAAVGTYSMVAKPMTVDGRYYTASRTLPVRVYRGRTAKVTVVYRPQGAVRDFHALKIEKTAVQLTWAATSVDQSVVRRTKGSVPAATRDSGTAVKVSGTKATDTGLQPGTDYSYALFVRRNQTWIGPLTLKVGTASADPTEATYVASPQTAILTAKQLVSAAPTGNGVRIVLAPGVPTPGVGAAVVLPVSSGLPGGFLGLVDAVSLNGRTLDLVAGSMDDAFDFWELNRPNVSAGNSPSGTKAKGSGTTGPVAPGKRKPLAENKVKGPTAVGPALLKCLGGSASQEISMAPGFDVAGHFNGKIDKYKVLGVELPKGASLDMAFAVTVSGAASIKTSGSGTCTLAGSPFTFMLSSSPVPVMAYVNPSVQISVGGAVNVSNVGLAATAGVRIKGHLGLTDGADFSADPIFSAVPLTPSVTVMAPTVGLKAGVELIVGPGAGTKDAGVIAGIRGEVNPVDASFGAAFPVGDPRFNVCLRAEAAFTRSLSLSAKAWLGNWDITRTITLDALQGRTEYPGSPWYFPAGCKDSVDPGDDVLGDGVTEIEDEVTGGDNQWGYVPGFVPGKNSWVLSTGDINAAIGSPDTFASSDLGGSGDDDLTALAGNPTYDAVAYTVKLVPTGSTLHVRYAFASEEYPEYVGSQYNDVMGVYVNGQNCAKVPGTDTAVSVNTINATTNAGYFVDNAAGASGYGTAMDGLTVPLECRVPVTPGDPVTVKITVADASDRIYDTAVALLDGGIWSD